MENKSHEYSVTDSWSLLCNAGLLTRFGYTEIVPNAARASINPLPSSLHHTRRLEASSPMIKDIMQSQTWPTLSPIHAAALVPEQKAMVEASASGRESLKKLSHSWRTAFLVSGLVVKQKGNATVYLSLGPWPNNSAAGMIPLERVEHHKLHFYKMPDNIQCQFKSIYAFQEWSVLDAVLASPLHVALLMAQKSKTKNHADLTVPTLPGFFLEKTKNVTPFLQYVAKEGFHTVSMGILKRLLKESSLA